MSSPVLALALALAGSDPSVVNLGIAVPRANNVLHQAGRWTVYVDAQTERLCALDVATGDALATGLQVKRTTSIVTPAPPVTSFSAGVQGSFALFEVDEGFLGTDVNGDGALDDSVWHVLDLRTGQVHSTDVAVVSPGYHVQGERVVFGARELENGDANGDGDIADTTVFLFDAHTGTTTGLGLAGFATIDGPLVLVAVDEMQQGATDLNGDGDTNDSVLHAYDVRDGRVTNLGLGGATPYLPGPSGLIAVSELQQGADLSGNGTPFDSVWYALDPAGGSPSDLGLAYGSAGFGTLATAARSFVALLVPETGIGTGTDANQDGDLLDRFVYAYSPRTRRAEALHLQANGVFGVRSLDGSRTVIASIGESQLASDLNGDGDMADFAVRRWTDGAITTVPFAASTIVSDDENVAFSVLESNHGQDLDGDGFLNSIVIVVSDFTTTTVLPWTPTAGFELTGGRFFTTRSEQQAGIDWTGNGSLSDDVLFSVDVATGAITNHALPILVPASFVPGPSAYGAGRAAVLVPEQSAGVDLNGNGFAFDFVLHAVVPR